MCTFSPGIVATLAILFVVGSMCTHSRATEPEKEDSAARKALEESLAQLNGALTDTPSPLHHQRAGILFRLGRFEAAIQDYTTGTQSGQPHDDDSCWERGLAQYYAGDFPAGQAQFARYHRVGSLDIENGLWRFLCIAESEGIAQARKSMYDYPKKLRPPFPALLALYLGEGDVDTVLAEAQRDPASQEDETNRLFYAHYYVGKYYELLKDQERAKYHLQQSLTHEIPHFMYACAEIDAQRLEAREVAEPAER